MATFLKMITAEKNSRRSVLLCVGLFVIIFFVFYRAVDGAFTNFDDNIYVTENPHVNTGFTLRNIQWAFKTFHAANWHPLTWISHMLDCQVFGLNPWGHHLINVLLHALNTALLFLLLKRMTGALGRAAACAALFGLHPLRVESVAWVAERKDVLSTFFWILSIWSYVEFSQTGSWSRRVTFYLSAVTLCACGLMSKSMLVTMPFLLLLLDFWPLNRLRFPVWPILLEKIPFLALSIVSSVVTFLAQKSGMAVQSLSSISLSSRLLNCVISYCRYLGKTFWPVDLAMYYPYAQQQSSIAVVSAVSLLLLISALTLLQSKKRAYLFVGWFWFLGTLVPVIGLVQLSLQSMADRYSYFPSIGLFIAVVWLVCDLTIRWEWRRTVLPISLVVPSILCAALTYRQIGYWSGSEMLYQHTLAVTKDNAVVHLNLGGYLSKDHRRWDEAIAEYQQAIALNPTLVSAYNNLGNIYSQLSGREDDAITQFQKAVARLPNYAEAHTNLGREFLRKGDLPNAVFQFEQAIKSNPNIVEAHANYGTALLRMGDIPGAIKEYNTALQIDPTLVAVQSNLAIATSGLKNEAQSDSAQHSGVGPSSIPSQAALDHFNRGYALAKTPEHLSEGINEYLEAIHIDPNFADAHTNLANAYQRIGQTYDAIKEYKTAIQLSPDVAKIHYNLGTTLLHAGRLDESIAEFLWAIKIEPKFAEAHNNLGVALANIPGRSDEAIAEFQEALRLNPSLDSARQRLDALAARPQ